MQYERRGIPVDERLRTTNRKIYAIGDVIGGLQFTHAANYHAGLVIRHALFRLPVRVNDDVIPWVTFTDPECDVVGGTWIGSGEAIGDFGKWGRPDLMRNLSCAGGAGSLEFARTCTGAAQSRERVILVDATGRRSTAVAYTLRCS